MTVNILFCKSTPAKFCSEHDGLLWHHFFGNNALWKSSISCSYSLQNLSYTAINCGPLGLAFKVACHWQCIIH